MTGGSHRFRRARVFQAMRTGIFECPREATIPDMARIMAVHGVHSVVVTSADPSGEGERVWGLVSAWDLARAASRGRRSATAGELAVLPATTATPDETLPEAARTMAASEADHLVVVQRGTGAPRGVLSALDIAAVLAGDHLTVGAAHDALP